VKDWIQEAKIQLETLFQNNALNQTEFIKILITNKKSFHPQTLNLNDQTESILKMIH
jgi:hypothetical protein